MTADSLQRPSPLSLLPAQTCAVRTDTGLQLVVSHTCAETAAQEVLAARGGVHLRYTKPQPWQTPLEQLKDRHVNYTAVVPLTDIPTVWHAGLRAYARRHEGRCYDQSTAGHYFVPDWYLLLSDPTPEADVVSMRQSGAPTEHPHGAWPKTGLNQLSDYLDVLQGLRFLACVVPPGTLAWYRLAIFMRPVTG